LVKNSEFKTSIKMGNSIGASGFGSSSTTEEVAKGIPQTIF
jgi:hypothetical protein